MKKFLLAAITFLALTISCDAQQGANWDSWSKLLGQWEGEGNGEPGQGAGIFSFSFDLDKKIVVRKSHSEYPASGNKPKIVHDDLMIIYLDMTGNPSKAIYFDNEGHTINYSISYGERSIILTSDKIPNVPVFRLIYTLRDNDTVDTKFELSQDGDKYMTYIEGTSKRTK